MLLGPRSSARTAARRWQQGGLFPRRAARRRAQRGVRRPARRRALAAAQGRLPRLVTLGFGEIIRVIFQNVESLGGALGLNGIPPTRRSSGCSPSSPLTVFVVTCLVHSTYGRGFLATHDDEIAAEAVGLNTTRYKIVAFVIGAFFAGIAGGLYGHFKLTITPTGFDFTKSIEIVVMVILGGMGNTVGVILAAILLTLLPEVLRPSPSTA
jgi:branched-chain amino acid transport system permease protein